MSSKLREVEHDFPEHVSRLCEIGGGDCKQMFLSLGCDVIGYWREMVFNLTKMEVDPCDGNMLGVQIVTKPLAVLCPLTCGCFGTNSSKRHCPGQCEAR